MQYNNTVKNKKGKKVREKTAQYSTTIALQLTHPVSRAEAKLRPIFSKKIENKLNHMEIPFKSFDLNDHTLQGLINGRQ